MENVREVGGSLAFVVLRDFYGTTQLVIEDAALLEQITALNKESVISVTGRVRERDNKNPKMDTGEIEVVPDSLESWANAGTMPCLSRLTAARRRTRACG